MADTKLSQEILEKHHDKYTVPHADDARKSDRKSENESASGQTGGKQSLTAGRQRRISRWRQPAPGKLSVPSLSSRDHHSLQRLENTYKLVPDPATRFSVSKVKAVVEEAIGQLVGGSKSRYDPESCRAMSKHLADDIKSRVKELGFARYKTVVHVMLGQLADQSMDVASRCVWDAKNDNRSTVTLQTGDLYVVVNVFATYYE